MKKCVSVFFGSMIVPLFTITVFATGQDQVGSDTTEGKSVKATTGVPTITLRVPLAGPAFVQLPAAVVNGDEITLADLNAALSSSHEGVGEGKQAAKIDYSKILKRLINVRLIIQEARNIGLDELPETKDLVNTYALAARKDMVIGELTKNIQPSEEDVEKLYRDVVKEWKVKSLLFKREEDARKIIDEITAGKNFDDVMAQAVREGIAQGGGEGQFLRPESLQPPVAAAAAKTKVGSLGPVVKITTGKSDAGYVVFKLEDVRYPDDPTAKERARLAVIETKKDETVKNYKRTLYKKQVILNRKLISSLDYESRKPGMESLLRDRRTIATIKGEKKPITVGDLSRKFQEKFYHGMESAAEAKKINSKKNDMLEEMIDKILFEREAAKRGIPKTAKYKTMIREYENSILFGTFIQKVVAPDVRVTSEDITAYYQQHAGEYTFPEMLRVDGLAFSTMNGAEAALAKLRQGADFSWMKANAEGQVEKSTKGLLHFEPNIVVITDFPDEMKKVITGARKGDFRLYTSPEGFFYVLSIQDAVPPQQQPLEEARGAISKKVYNNTLRTAVEAWADKLRAAADITVYLLDSGP